MAEVPVPLEGRMLLSSVILRYPSLKRLGILEDFEER